MKKWILVILLYGLGFLFVEDVLGGLEFLGEHVLDPILNENPQYFYYVRVVIQFVPLLFVLLNYFILRIRARNAAFTLINALFVSLFVMSLLLSKQHGFWSDSILGLGDILTDAEGMQRVWDNFYGLIIIGGINIISGVVISEAKSKGTYLTAEFIYLLTGLFLGLFIAAYVI